MSIFRDLLSMPNRRTEAILFPVQYKTNSNGELERVLITKSVRLPTVTELDDWCFRGVFQNMSDIEYFSLDDLTVLHNVTGAFSDTFKGTSSLTGVVFPKGLSITGDSIKCFANAFYGADLTKLTSFPFSNLKTANGMYVMDSVFRNVTFPSSWQSINFDELESIGNPDVDSRYSFRNSFSGSTIRNYNFPELEYIKSSNGFENAFPSGSTINCPVLQTIIGGAVFKNSTKTSTLNLDALQTLDSVPFGPFPHQIVNYSVVNAPALSTVNGQAFLNIGKVELDSVISQSYYSETYKNIDELRFRNLTNIQGIEKETDSISGLFSGSFGDIYFNKLAEIPETYLFTCSYSGETLNPQSTATLHFAQVNKASIMSSKGYDVRWGLGAEAVVEFDLVPDSDELYKFSVKLLGGNKGTIAEYEIPYGKTLRQYLEENSISLDSVQNQTGIDFVSWDKSLDIPIKEDCEYTASYTVTVTFGTTDPDVMLWKSGEWVPLIDNPLTETIPWNTQSTIVPPQSNLSKKGYDFDSYTVDITQPITISQTISPVYTIIQVSVRFIYKNERINKTFVLYDSVAGKEITVDYGSSVNTRLETASNVVWKDISSDLTYPFEGLNTEIHHELGYQFRSWSYLSSRESVFDFYTDLTPYDRYTTLYAFFTEIRVTLTFDVNPDVEDDGSDGKWMSVSVLEGTQFKDVPTPRETVAGNIPAGSGFDAAAESWYYFDSESNDYVLLRKMSSTYLVMTDMTFYPKYIGTDVTLNFVDIQKDYTTTENPIDFVRIWNTGDRIKYPYEVYDTEEFNPESEKEYFSTGYVKELDTATENLFPEDVENNNAKGVYQPDADGSVFLGWTKDNTYNFTEKWGNVFWYHRLKPSQDDFKVWFEGLTNYIGIRRTNLHSAIKKRYSELLDERILGLTGKEDTSEEIAYASKLVNADPELFSSVITTKESDGIEYPSLGGDAETLINSFDKKTQYYSLLTTILGTESTYTQTASYTYHAFQQTDFGFIIRVSRSSVSDNGFVMTGVPLEFTQTTGNVNYCSNGLLYSGYFSDVPFSSILIEDEYDDHSVVLEENSILQDVVDFIDRREQIRRIIEEFFIDTSVPYTQNKNSLYDRIAVVIGDSERFAGLLTNIRSAIDSDTILTEYETRGDTISDLYNTKSGLGLDDSVIDSVVKTIYESDSESDALFEECVGYIRNNRVYPVTTAGTNDYINDSVRYTTADTTYSDIISNVTLDETLKGYIQEYLGYTDPIDPDGEPTEQETYSPFIDPRNIKQSGTVYGYWMLSEVRNKTYTLTYEVGSQSITKTVNLLDTIQENDPTIPTSPLYDIGSWDYYKNNQLVGDFEFGVTPITGDTRLLANLIPKTFVVTYDYNYGEDTQYTLAYGARLQPEYVTGQTSELVEESYTSTEIDEETGDSHDVVTVTYSNKEYEMRERLDRGVFIGYTTYDVDLKEHILNTYPENVIDGYYTFRFGEQPTQEELSNLFMGSGIGQYIYNFNNVYNPEDGQVLHGYWLPVYVRPPVITVTFVDIESGFEIVEDLEYDTIISGYAPRGYVKDGDWKDAYDNVVDIIDGTVTTLYGKLIFTINVSDIVADDETVIHNVRISDIMSNSGWDGTTTVRFAIDEGYGIGSTDADHPSLIIDGAYPLGLEINNDGIIAGAGGKGGSYVNGYGQPGGTAIKALVECKLTNNGTIAGGGGGGGAGAVIKYNTNIYNDNMSYLNTYFYNAYGSGGGGGAGIISGTGGASIGTTQFYPEKTGGEINLVLSGSVGKPGSETVGGEGGAETSYVFEGGIPRTVYSTAGGKGGDLGESGESGGNGYTGFEDLDATEYRELVIGYAGGAAGAAIEGTDKISLSGDGVIKGLLNT